MHGTIEGQQLCLFHGSIPEFFFLRRGIPRAKVLFWCDGGTTGGADEVDVIISFAVMVDVRQTAEIARDRSEEHTSELQSRGHLVCRLLLEKTKKRYSIT